MMYGINRIRLEFKDRLIQCVHCLVLQVLIESDWNLKWAHASLDGWLMDGINRIRLEFKGKFWNPP